MKVETKKQLKEIYDLLISSDYESRVLGYNLFQSSKFRKYIRNKCYSHRNSTNICRFKYILNPLVHICRSNNEWKKEEIEYNNGKKIEELKSVLYLYLHNLLELYDYSEYKRKHKK